jgi:hypothetical protein
MGQPDRSMVGSCKLVTQLTERFRSIGLPVAVHKSASQGSGSAPAPTLSDEHKDIIGGCLTRVLGWYITDEQARLVCEAVWAMYIKSPTAIDLIFEEQYRGYSLDQRCEKVLARCAKATKSAASLRTAVLADQDRWIGATHTHPHTPPPPMKTTTHAPHTHTNTRTRTHAHTHTHTAKRGPHT